MADVLFADLTMAVDARDPQFADLVIRLLEQPDPPEDRPEDAEDGQTWPALPEDTWTLARVRQALSADNLADKTPTERKNARKEAFEGVLNAPYPPPRLKLGPLLVKMYEDGDPWAKRQLVTIFLRAKIGFGIWHAFKTVYKQAERQHDAAMFGALAWRLDAIRSTPTTGEITAGTFLYMRRRAWRYLRQLGRAVPELYPEFAIQVLRHYPAYFNFSVSWVASQIWAHGDLIGQTMASFRQPPKDLKKRAYPDAWKQSADPLLRLLEDAANDTVCDFAIRSLKKDFPDRLGKIDAEWIGRIGKKPLASVHEFVVGLLTDSPEFHQSKLEGLGLHDMVLDFLLSDSKKAREYAVAYARAHAPHIPVDRLVTLAKDGAKEVRKFAITRILERKPQDIGLDALIVLLGTGESEKEIKAKIEGGFAPTDLSSEQFYRLYDGTNLQQSFVSGWYKSAKAKPPTDFFLFVLDHPKCGYRTRQRALEVLDKRSGSEIGLAWFKKALDDRYLKDVATRWLKKGKLSKEELDVDWVKSLVVHTRFRQLGLSLLNNKKLVSPASLGLKWLLAMARHADPTVHEFVHRYLLEHFTPEDFGGKGDAGIERLYTLATDKNEPDAVRRFAATYLSVHHPEHGPKTSEARSLGIKPRLSKPAYGIDRLRPLFFDEREDVRRLAVTLGRYELVGWNDRTLLYTLAGSRFRESRTFAIEVLLQIGQPDVEPTLIPDIEWLDAAAVFALTESPEKSAREAAMGLIGTHYERLGGAGRLAWLMESPAREVRLAAVRLLWDRHRPHVTTRASSDKPAERKPTERFDSTNALRMFLRTVLFGLPPGRMERRDVKSAALFSRPLPASVAKRRLLEVVRQMALEDRAFAELVLPVVEEFTHSVAKGEWQTCVATLAQIRRAHPGLEVALPAPIPPRVAEARE